MPHQTARLTLHSTRTAYGRRVNATLGLTYPMSNEPADLFASLDAKGEDQVRLDMAMHIYNEPRTRLVLQWLAQKDRVRAEYEDTRKTAREEETIAIAKEALNTARRANKLSEQNVAAANISATSAQTQARWAKWAAIIAVVAAIVSAKDDIIQLLARTL